MSLLRQPCTGDGHVLPLHRIVCIRCKARWLRARCVAAPRLCMHPCAWNSSPPKLWWHMRRYTVIFAGSPDPRLFFDSAVAYCQNSMGGAMSSRSNPVIGEADPPPLWTCIPTGEHVPTCTCTARVYVHAHGRMHCTARTTCMCTHACMQPAAHDRKHTTRLPGCTLILVTLCSNQQPTGAAPATHTQGTRWLRSRRCAPTGGIRAG